MKRINNNEWLIKGMENMENWKKESFAKNWYFWTITVSKSNDWYYSWQKSRNGWVQWDWNWQTLSQVRVNADKLRLVP